MALFYLYIEQGGFSIKVIFNLVKELMIMYYGMVLQDEMYVLEDMILCVN
jgi:hypothetical protein